MIINEDMIVNWVNSQNGLLITRKISNIDNFNFNDKKENIFVCISGYPDIISDFFNNKINNFTNSIILIIIESDIIELQKEYLFNIKLKHCFTWNKPFHHQKLSGIPIGLNHDRQYKVLFDWINKNDIKYIINDESKKLLCMNYSPQTNPERVKLIEKSNNEWKNFCTILDFIPSLSTYYIHSFIDGQIKIDVTNPECYNQWKKYKFVLSPPGAGIDCHRTWEAISVGCIPIVLSSNLNELYEDLPIYIVNSWDDINEDNLNRQYDLIINNFNNGNYNNNNKLNLEYWIEKISNIKDYPSKIHFITYGNDLFAKSKKRLVKEADEFEEFSSIKAYGTEDLPEEIILEKKTLLLKSFIENNPRGGGYWIWKPIILEDSLNYINDNDYIVYLDASCKLNKEGKSKFNEYINLLNDSNYGILSFQMKNHIEKIWTTREIFNYFNIDINSDMANSGQLLGGIFIIKKNNHSSEYIKKISDTILNNVLLCTDIYNNTNQISEFRENRHDQSISSIIQKIHGSVIIDRDETYIIPFGEGESLKYPFWATKIRD